MSYRAAAVLCLTACGRIAFDEIAGDRPPLALPVTCDRALPPPAGTIVELVPGDDLVERIAAATPDTTYVLADGTYPVLQPIMVRAPRVTIRSASGNPGAVILDGSFIPSPILATLADDTVIAELSVRSAMVNAIEIGVESQPVRGAVLYRIEVRDAGAAMVRVASRSNDGIVACSRLEQTDAGRARADMDGDNCSSGGIVAIGASGWTVRDNQITGLTCNAGNSLPAISFTRASALTVATNNLIVDCSRSINYGNGGATGQGHTGGAILNNVIWTAVDVDVGISLEQAAGTRVYHNTVLAGPGAMFFSSIDHRFPQTTADIRNNLVSRITERDGSSATLAANHDDTDLFYVADPFNLDFHLTAAAVEAIDRGEVVEDAGLDLDGEPHTNGPPDIGADER